MKRAQKGTHLQYVDDRYTNLLLNAFINRHAHTECLKMIQFYSPLGIWHVFYIVLV